jgi:hypothetical protein
MSIIVWACWRSWWAWPVIGSRIAPMNISACEASDSTSPPKRGCRRTLGREEPRGRPRRAAGGRDLQCVELLLRLGAALPVLVDALAFAHTVTFSA